MNTTTQTEQEATALLAFLYRHFHEGASLPGVDPVIPRAETDDEALAIIHNWLVNHDADPYTNGGPEEIAEMADSASRNQRTYSYWKVIFCEIKKAFERGSQ